MSEYGSVAVAEGTSMGRPWDEIQRLVVDMQGTQGPTLAKMREVLIRYEGDYVLPVVEVPNEPRMPPLTPALIAETVDNAATRASSVNPTVYCPALHATQDRGRGSQEWAQKRRRFISAVYDSSKWQLGRRRSYRHLAAYNTMSMLVLPDARTQMPKLIVRDPLATFCEPRSMENLDPPNYVAYVTRFSGSDLRARFPVLRGERGGPISDVETEQLWDIVEWIDHEVIVFGLVGPCMSYGNHIYSQAQMPHMEMARMPNKAERCVGFMPTNVSLGGVASRLGMMLGNVDLQAKLVALDILATERGIFPDMYVVGDEAQPPDLVSGEWHDGRTGKINLVHNARSIGLLHVGNQQGTQQMVDRLERNYRTSVGLVPQYGGETYGALRTGRAIDAMTNIAVDPRIMELHEVMAVWQRHVNEAILATAKGYYGGKKYEVFSGWPGDEGLVEFTPDTHCESYENVVSYPFAGSDIVQLTQVLGGMLGTEAISLDTFREQHPYIRDPEAERAKVRSEQMERSALQALSQQLIQGTLPLPVASMVHDELEKGVSIFKAIENADRKMRELQAQQAPPAPEGMVSPPEAMPGMAAGPAALQQPQAEPQIEPVSDVAAMRSLMSQMNAGAR